jgi:Tfp pilus assembly protein PilO
VTITGLIREIKDKKLVSQKLEEKINSLNAAQQEYSTVQSELYLVDQALPKDSQIFLLMKQLETLAFKSGVSLEALQYSPVNLKGEVEEKKPSTVDFKIVLAGSYENLRNFLISLIKLRRVIILDGFAFKTRKAGEGLSLSINAKAYFLKEEK